jgi:FHIPEP family
MSDVTAAGPAPAAAAPTGGFQFPSLNALGTMLKRGDIVLAVGVLTILVVLILPPIFLDLFLAISIILSALPNDGAVHLHVARILRLPDRAPDRDHAAAVAAAPICSVRRSAPSGVLILDNVQLEANNYVIKIKEVEGGTGRVWPGQHMVMDPTGPQVKLPGLHTTEPTFGLPAT